MKRLRTLYRYCEKNQIDVLDFPLPQTGSLSVELDNGRCFIGLDYAALSTGAQELTHLAHEVGHCVTGSFYSRYTKIDCRQRHENRANKWAIRRLIPVAELDRAVAEGCTTLFELAEHFGVEEDFMLKAICLYTHGNLATELYF